MFLDPISSPPRQLTFYINAILQSTRHSIHLFIDEVLRDFLPPLES
jgi:hypothetical protein